MAITPAFDIARRALIALETALGVVGNNIANANTAGYTRQVAEFEADRATLSASGLLVGRGVHIASIDQIVDPLVEQRLIRADSEQAGLAAKRDELQRLASTLGDLQSPSLSSQVSDFFDAADAVARNPGGLAERQALLGAGEALAGELNRRSASVATLQRTVDARIVEKVNGTNDAIQRIAALNGLIVSQEASGAHANDLRDERSRELSTLAKALPITVQEQADGGVRVTARDGTVLVDGGLVSHQIGTQTGAPLLDGTLRSTLGFASPTGGPLLVQASAFTEGELGELADVRDDAIAQASANLDTVANTLRTSVNAVQQAGVDLDGNSTAAVPFFSGTGAATLAVAITDPRLVAAALTTDPGDNANALALADLRTTNLPALGNTSFGGYLSIEQARLGEDAKVVADAADGATKVTTSLEAERSSLSGVNVNEELVNLIRYQRAFQASAQVVNVANTMLDDLLKLV